MLGNRSSSTAINKGEGARASCHGIIKAAKAAKVAAARIDVRLGHQKDVN